MGIHRPKGIMSFDSRIHADIIKSMAEKERSSDTYAKEVVGESGREEDESDAVNEGLRHDSP